MVEYIIRITGYRRHNYILTKVQYAADRLRSRVAKVREGRARGRRTTLASHRAYALVNYIPCHFDQSYSTHATSPPLDPSARNGGDEQALGLIKDPNVELESRVMGDYLARSGEHLCSLHR